MLGMFASASDSLVLSRNNEEHSTLAIEVQKGNSCFGFESDEVLRWIEWMGTWKDSAGGDS